MLHSADFPEGVRVAVALRGIRMGTGRQPLSDEHKAALAKLQATIRKLLAEEGLAGFPSVGHGNAPPNGRAEGGTGMMPVARGKAAAQLDEEQVTEIVTAVVTALQRQGVV